MIVTATALPTWMVSAPPVQREGCLTFVLFLLWPHVIALQLCCPHVIFDSTVAAEASHHSTVVAVGSPVSAVITLVAGAPATRAAAERLWPPIFLCEMSVNDSILGKFLIYFLLR